MHGPEALQRALDRMLEETTTRIAAAEAWRLRAIEYRSRVEARACERFDGRRCKPHTEHAEGDKVHTDDDSDSLEQQILLLIDETPKAITWDRIGGMQALKRELKFHYNLALAKAPPGVRLEGWRNIMLYAPRHRQDAAGLRHCPKTVGNVLQRQSQSVGQQMGRRIRQVGDDAVPLGA